MRIAPTAQSARARRHSNMVRIVAGAAGLFVGHFFTRNGMRSFLAIRRSEPVAVLRFRGGIFVIRASFAELGCIPKVPKYIIFPTKIHESNFRFVSPWVPSSKKLGGCQTGCSHDTLAP